MNGQLSLTESIQMSFLSASKPKHAIIKNGLEILNGQVSKDKSGSNASIVQISDEKINIMLQCILYILEHSSLPDEVQQFSKDEYESVVFLTLYEIFQEGLRTRVEKKQFQSDLQSFHLSKKYITLFVSTLYDNLENILLCAREKTISNPSLTNFDWRIDVILSSTSLNKAFTSVLLFQCTLSTGDIKTFEVSVEKFHQLRYSVAKMLANMQSIDQHPTLMRLID